MKKYFAVVLVIILISGIFNLTYADELSDQNYKDSANKLNILGLFSGVGLDEDGLPIYDLEREPTRQEAITMLVRLLGKESVAKTGDWEHPFNDVSDWAQSYVGFAYENNLTKGLSNNTFGSNNKVTESQYLTFILRALKYEEGEDFNWDNPYIITNEIGLTNEKTNGTFNRGRIAEISFTALKKYMKNTETSLVRELYRNKIVNLEQIESSGLGDFVEENIDDNNMTRVKLAKFISDNFNLNEIDSNIKIPDIEEHKYEDEMLEVVSAKIMHKYPDNTFKPNRTLTRAEFSSFLINILEFHNYEIPNKIILNKEVQDISNNDWFKNSMAFALNAGIIEVDDSNKAYPNKVASDDYLNSYTIEVLKSYKEKEEENENEDILNTVFHLDALFERLPIKEYVKIFDYNGVYYEEYDSFHLDNSKYFEDGNISYKEWENENQLVGHFTIGYQTDEDFESFKDLLKDKYGNPFTEDLNEYDDTEITRWNDIELRRNDDYRTGNSYRGKKTTLWFFISEDPENDELTTSEIIAYLEDNFKTLKTNIGTTEFEFSINENNRTYNPYDYKIQVGYEYDYFEGAMNSIEYTRDEKDQLKRELKNHQKDIAEALMELLPDKKLYGGYYDSWYKYRYLKVGLQTRRYYSWTNYDVKADYYEDAKASHFRWYDFIDDEL